MDTKEVLEWITVKKICIKKHIAYDDDIWPDTVNCRLPDALNLSLCQMFSIDSYGIFPHNRVNEK